MVTSDMIDHSYLLPLAQLPDFLDSIDDTMSEIAPHLLSWTINIFVRVVTPVGVIFMVFYLLRSPLRRNERARLFVDLLETGLSEGRSPEATILEISYSRDKVLGQPFLMLAGHLHRGLSLIEGLWRIPRFLPPQVVSMLELGVKLGDMKKVLPAIRRLLAGGASRAQGAQNYVVLLALTLNPAALAILPFLVKRVLRMFPEIFEEMVPNAPLPVALQFVFNHSLLLAFLQIGLFLALLVGTLVYVGNTKWLAWIEPALGSWRDRMVYLIPWRRKRLQRDFSAMLSILLDAEVPEADAVTMAAASTANGVFVQRAERVVKRLREGVPLAQAAQAMDDEGEFRWRLANAAHSHSGFFTALAGWQDSLEAKAYQQEQAAAHAITTALVLCNGLIVGLVVVGVFQVLVTVVWDAASLW